MKHLHIFFYAIVPLMACANVHAMKNDNEKLGKIEFKQSDKIAFLKNILEAATLHRFDAIAKAFKEPKCLAVFSNIYRTVSFDTITPLGKILGQAKISLGQENFTEKAPHILEIIEAILTNTGIMLFVIACPKSGDKAILQHIFVIFAQNEYHEGVKRLLDNAIFSKLVGIEYLREAQKHYPDNDEPTSTVKVEIIELLAQAIKAKEEQCNQK